MSITEARDLIVLFPCYMIEVRNTVYEEANVMIGRKAAVACINLGFTIYSLDLSNEVLDNPLV